MKAQSAWLRGESRSLGVDGKLDERGNVQVRSGAEIRSCPNELRCYALARRTYLDVCHQPPISLPSCFQRLEQLHSLDGILIRLHRLLLLHRLQLLGHRSPSSTNSLRGDACGRQTRSRGPNPLTSCVRLMKWVGRSIAGSWSGATERFRCTGKVFEQLEHPEDGERKGTGCSLPP